LNQDMGKKASQKSKVKRQSVSIRTGYASISARLTFDF